MLDTKDRTVQTTVRMNSDKLREVQYYLSLEKISLSAFLAEYLYGFLEQYRQAHPERVPGGRQRDD